MRRLLVCGKWTLHVDLPAAERTAGSHPYHASSLEAMGRRAVCREALITSAGPAGSVVELFGGLGVTSLIIRGTLAPSTHRIYELDPALVAHLRRNTLDAEEADAYAVAPTLAPADLVDADLGFFTVLHWFRDRKARALMDALFGGGHGAVVVTDHAVSRLGAHRARYTALLGERIAVIDDYLHAWSRLFASEYGYAMMRAEWQRGSSYTLWKPGAHEPSITRTAARYPGVSDA